ncbi:hypothetical protein [uncultured Tateyamaria sp.]|uniref:hypothetical protein n=1 Tax=uncultured Tateyamaria sp. TaxID=455651 RepID=UPI0026260F0D|nr:hypothetical protein [uncultured Tateyamaria sp.]
MAIIRTYEEVLALNPTGAERKLIEACKAGEWCVLGDGTCPETLDPQVSIRAEILRFLLLGGCADCLVDAQGTMMEGGAVTGTLDVNFAQVHGTMQLRNCYFEEAIECLQTSMSRLDLSGSRLHGLRAQKAHIDGGVFLRRIRSSQEIDLNSATIDGQLGFEGTQMACDGAYAISAPDARIEGGVFFHPRTALDREDIETPFHSTGEIRLNGATMGGLYAQQCTFAATSTGQSLSLGGATVNGAVRLDGCDSTGEILLAGSRISGRLTCERIKLRNDSGHAFNGQAMRVEHAFVWKKVEHRSGGVSLNGAHVAELDDQPDNWPPCDQLFLDGFTYDRIKGTVSTSPARMDWLRDGSYFGVEFRPQPYSQYAKFLRDTGHDEDARRVLYTRERKRRASTRAQLSASGHSLAMPINLWSRFWDTMLRFVVGYGHYPFRSVAALAVLICFTIIPAHFAWEEGSFAPNAAPILVSDGWKDIAATEPNPAAIWSGDEIPADSTFTAAAWKAAAPGRDWETFNRYAYGFDVVIPIIDFGQTDAWAPSTTRDVWGWHLWWARWVLSAMGWIVTALGAAAITGIIRRE